MQKVNKDDEFCDGRCPMRADIITKYNLTDEFIERFCNEGCSVECGKFLKEKLDKMGLLQIEGQMSIEDYLEV